MRMLSSPAVMTSAQDATRFGDTLWTVMIHVSSQYVFPHSFPSFDNGVSILHRMAKAVLPENRTVNA